MPEPLANLDASKLLFFSDGDPETTNASLPTDDPATFPRTFKRTPMAMVGKPPVTAIVSNFTMPIDLD